MLLWWRYPANIPLIYSTIVFFKRSSFFGYIRLIWTRIWFEWQPSNDWSIVRRGFILNMINLFNRNGEIASSLSLISASHVLFDCVTKRIGSFCIPLYDGQIWQWTGRTTAHIQIYSHLFHFSFFVVHFHTAVVYLSDSVGLSWFQIHVAIFFLFFFDEKMCISSTLQRSTRTLAHFIRIRAKYIYHSRQHFHSKMTIL